MDDYVHALIRTQHVVSISGNTLSGGLDEPVFDIHLGAVNNHDSRVGTPAAGVPPRRISVIFLKLI